MKPTIIITLFAFLGCIKVFSQSTPEQVVAPIALPDTLGNYELGINTYFAFDRWMDQSGRSPLEVMLKRKIKANRMLRVRVYGNLYKSNKVEFNVKDMDRQAKYGLAIGHEWLKTIHRKWQWYYGLELEGSRDRRHILHERPRWNEAMDITYLEKTDNYHHMDRLALSPLSGIRFSISPRLLFSTEFRLVGSVGRQRITTEESTKMLDEGVMYQLQSTAGHTISENGIRFQPYTGIFLNYRF
ncbi:MAG: hypothetical protein JJU34_16915 [Lunatimonas sp.]|uniref:hypothetical protein n=1 Tax=Lunatimonas sp. TaxID=2060141 RepID=UPI00263AE76A|nr:hypothetical protein [Lunatimonas sp.]MCC5938962.1 hypothetical protein [Lunatimonas sp.]